MGDTRSVNGAHVPAAASPYSDPKWGIEGFVLRHHSQQYTTMSNIRDLFFDQTGLISQRPTQHSCQAPTANLRSEPNKGSSPITALFGPLIR
jgi:hypothetical protein